MKGRGKHDYIIYISNYGDSTTYRSSYCVRRRISNTYISSVNPSDRNSSFRRKYSTTVNWRDCDNRFNCQTQEEKEKRIIQITKRRLIMGLFVFAIFTLRIMRKVLYAFMDEIGSVGPRPTFLFILT